MTLQLRSAKAFFASTDTRFPLDQGKTSFDDFVKARLESYQAAIQLADESDSIIAVIKANADSVRELCDRIQAAINEYLRGFPHRAYRHIEQGIEPIREHLARLVSTAVHPFVSQFYRTRTPTDPEAQISTKGEMFHIPFEMRHKVPRQRYSIPGIPCLYLGGSLYICWEELGRPRFESLYISRFAGVAERQISILDFMQRPAHIVAGISDYEEEGTIDNDREAKTAALGVCWPLMAMAAIRRKHGASPFIVEYIIPQLLLQWIMENKSVDGIAYSSVACKTHMTYPAATANFVFPAKEPRAVGHCAKLQERFQLTDPVAWRLLEGVPVDGEDTSAGPCLIELIPGTSVEYRDTPFGLLEEKLLGLNAGRLSDTPGAGA